MLLSFILFFGRELGAGRFLIAADAFYYSYPLRSTAWQMIRHGVAPVWTPAVLSGYPLLAMSQLGFGYPLTWNYLFLPGHWAEQIYLLAPFLLSPVFTYFYTRQIGRSRFASLLAGLSFAYGGGMMSKLAVIGYPPNTFLWLPLVLIAIERSRTKRFLPCLLGATGAYAMAVLNGYGQGILYVGIIAVLYAAFISRVSADSARHKASADAPFSRVQWLPLAVALGGIALAAGVAAFQILETLRAARRSIRSSLTYEVFSAGAFTPLTALRSLVAPLYHYIEVSLDLAPLAFALAVYGIVRARRHLGGDARVMFWLAVVLIASALMLGDATPLNWLSYQLPVYNRFRYPSRHAFEWTFALAVLSAYGWDALRAAAPFTRWVQVSRMSEARQLLLVVASLLLSVAVAVFWWRATTHTLVPFGGPDTGRGTALPETIYLLFRLGFTLLVSVSAWLSWTVVAAPRRRAGLLAATIMLACLAEPFIMASCWWFPDAKPASRFVAVSPAIRRLQNYTPEPHRVYTRVNLYLTGYTSQTPPLLDLPNLTALHGIQNVAGYEQLILERYSRALGNVGPDAVNPRYDMAGGTPDATLFANHSHVLDLLNTSFVVTYANLATLPEGLTTGNGLRFSGHDLGVTLQAGESAVLGYEAEGDTLALVTSLANSTDVANDAPVATLRLYATDGRIIERTLCAGADTAEWAHERADVRATVAHKLAPVFDDAPGDAADSFRSHRYLARVDLGERLRVRRVEITGVASRAALAVSKATLYDSASGQSSPLLAPVTPELDPARWELFDSRDGVFVWRNRRAMPRAWLVTEAKAVDGEAALRRVRGEARGEFDPRRTALLEVSPGELPSQPGGLPAASNVARVVEYAPNRLAIETDAPMPTVLVVSEIFYPGWEATVDGVAHPIMLTDFLLRGVSLPAGRHRVEMKYAAPAARVGSLISLGTLALIVSLAFVARRRANGAAGGAPSHEL